MGETVLNKLYFDEDSSFADKVLMEITLKTLEEIDSGVIILGFERRIVFWNKWFSIASQIDLEEAIGRKIEEVFPALRNGTLLEAIDRATNANKIEYLLQPILEKDDKKSKQIISIKPLSLSNNTCYSFINILDSKTISNIEDQAIKENLELKAALAAMKRLDETVKHVFESTSDGMLLIDSKGKIKNVNTKGERIFQTNVKFLLGLHLSEFIDEVPPGEDLNQLLAELNINFNKTVELTGKRHGAEFPIEFNLGKIKELGDDKFIVVVKDITGRKLAEAKIIKQARYDLLTGLNNIEAFHEKLEEVLNRSRRHNRMFALIYLDLDDFSTINKFLGSDVGDELLKYTADKLRLILRKSDVMARVKEDEYGIILENISKPEHAALVAQKLIFNISMGLNLFGQDSRLSASLGISIFPVDGRDNKTLIENAKKALEKSKSTGKHKFCYFHNELDARAHRRLELEADLRNAIVKNEFVLYFQPQVSLKNACTIGGEALIRWQHKNRGLIPPFEFIPMAEETPFIIPMGDWVVADAIKTMNLLEGMGIPNMKIGVNVSSKQFQSDSFTNAVSNAIGKTNIDPRSLVVEITESHIIEDTKRTTRILNELREIGVKVALDDFGTGYSSLSHLKNIPIDILKIDRSFIKDLGTDPNSIVILDALLDLAKGFNIEVVTEGVETKEQLNFLKERGCDIIQGYYFSKPLPIKEFLEFVKKPIPLDKI